jgi:ATP-dependent protease ClpP protease subunit
MARRGGKLGPIAMSAPPRERRATVPEGVTQRSWFRVWDRASGASPANTARIDIYEEIGGWGVSAQMFADMLRQVDAGDIDLHINSPGGSVFDGVTIYNALTQHPATVNVYVDGLAASAASFIAQAGDSITMNPGSMMMVHDAIGMTWGNAFDHTLMAGLLAQVSDSIADLYAMRAGGTAAQWRSVMEDNGGEGRWYTARAAVEAGLADRVAGDADPEDQGDADRVETTDDDPAEVFDRSSIAAGRRLVQAQRDQILSQLPAVAQATRDQPEQPESLFVPIGAWLNPAQRDVSWNADHDFSTLTAQWQ